MHTALSTTQGKTILGGRNPFEIVPYAQALKSLKDCLTFDDTKYWDNYADAAKAWGQIHHSEEVIRLSKALKLKAAQRMGELALALKGTGGRGKGNKGAHTLLQQRMSAKESEGCLILAKKPTLATELSERKNPPALLSVRHAANLNPWTSFSARGFASFSGLVSTTDPKLAAKWASSGARDIDAVRRQAQAACDWLDTFMAALPKKAR